MELLVLFTFSLSFFSLNGSPSQPVDHSVAFGPGDIKSRTVFPVGLRDKRISCLPLSAERSPGRKDSFFFGLRQAKRTVRRATSNAEKTLLYVKLEAEEKTALGLVALPVVPLRREMALLGVYICITDGPDIKKDSGASPICRQSDLNRSRIDLRPMWREVTDLLGTINIHLSRARVTEGDLVLDTFAIRRGNVLSEIAVRLNPSILLLIKLSGDRAT